MSKSAKVNSVRSHSVLIANIDERYCKVYASEDLSFYVLEAGYAGNTADYREEHETLEELETSMREFQSDLRKWSYAEY